MNSNHNPKSNPKFTGNPNAKSNPKLKSNPNIKVTLMPEVILVSSMMVLPKVILDEKLKQQHQEPRAQGHLVQKCSSKEV